MTEAELVINNDVILDGDELPEGGGVLTPALALGAVLRRRLSAAEGGEFMQFRISSETRYGEHDS